ncbi:MAG: helicase-related protein [Eubacteriales bacterium]|nr:helicase-related protein [Eubacteriales bacterium]
MVPSVPLAAQWIKELKSVLPALGISEPQCGIFHGSRKEDPEQDYLVYVLNSARHAIARHILADMKQGYHVLLIMDECHRCASPENSRIFDFLNQEAGSSGAMLRRYHSLGLSATIRPEDYETVLKPALGKEIYRYRFADALRDGYVSSFSIYHIGLSFSAQELREYSDLSDQMSALYRQLVSWYPSIKQLGSSRLFSVLRKIARDEGEDSLAAFYLNLAYKRKGVGCYHSQMTPQAKKNTLAAYRDGIYRILVSCKGLDEGIDVPEASVGIVLSGSSVSRQRIQRLGRILRRKEGKSACLYYLYVRESSEDGSFLADPDGIFPVCDLSYSALEDDFCHPAYEKSAAELLNACQQNGLSGCQQAELRRCLLTGLTRPDWLESPGRCAALITAARNQRTRNYWIAMKKLAEKRELLSPGL